MSDSSSSGTTTGSSTGTSTSGTIAVPFDPGSYNQNDYGIEGAGEEPNGEWAPFTFGGLDYPDSRAPVAGTPSTIGTAAVGQTGLPLGVTITPTTAFAGAQLLPLVVEDGTGYEDATSYASLTDANLYMSANVHFWPVWNSIQPADQANLLMMATRYLDDRTDWYGQRQHQIQGLEWPRKDVFDRDGVWVPHNTLPKKVKSATIEMAKFLISQDRSIERQTDGIKTIEVDVVKIYLDQGYRLPAVPSLISFMLRGLGGVSSGPNSFAKIRRA